MNAELPESTRHELAEAGLTVDDVCRVIGTALDEDLRYGPDVTTEATVAPQTIAVAEITPREQGTLAGVVVAKAVFESVLGADCHVLQQQADGDRAVIGEPALVVQGTLRGLLTAERTALNLICHLSGVATVTAAWVAAIADTGATVRDCRKTLPGLRLLQKYAVRCGGGVNHRLGLGDAVLIKDNHVRAAGSVAAALAAVRERAPGLPREIEVDDLDQLDAMLAARAELVLLDNFTPEQCKTAVLRARAAGGHTKLEASGGLTLDRARLYAQTGVDFLSVGAITHSSRSLDLGMDLR